MLGSPCGLFRSWEGRFREAQGGSVGMLLLWHSSSASMVVLVFCPWPSFLVIKSEAVALGP